MKLLNFLIQLFAEEGTDVPTEEVENEQPEEVEEEVEDVEFEDTEEETEEETEETNEEDSEKETKETQTKHSKNDTLTEKINENKINNNKINAQRRIEERQKRREAELQRQAKIDTLKKVSGGINKFTGEKIVDEEDIEEYEIMLELDSQGKDVLEEYPKYIKAKKREARIEAQKQKEAETQAEEKMQKDLNDFIEKYDQQTANKLFNDDKFIAFSNKLLGNVPLIDIYELYTERNKEIQKEIDEKLIQKEARKKSSPGIPGKKVVKEKGFDDMTPEEFHEFNMRVAQGYK